MSDSDSRARELEGLLDDLSYQVTSARAVGLGRPDDLRTVIKSMRKLVADLDAVAVTEVASRSGEKRQ